MGSVALHELYFGNLGGFRHAGPTRLGRPTGTKCRTPSRGDRGGLRSASAWRREFVERRSRWRAAQDGAPHYSRRQKRFWNQIATDHTQAAVDAAPCSFWTCTSTRTRWTSA